MGLIEKTCERCGKIFRVSHWQAEHKNPRFCSRECRWDAGDGLPVLVDRICPVCGRTFQARRQYLRHGQARCCSARCSGERLRKHPTIEFQGGLYSLEESGYYRCKRLNLRLHQAVWISHFGAIPEGCVVHHIDGNKDNNAIENLTLATRRLHAHTHRRPRGICQVQGCDRPLKGNGLCKLHYERERRAKKLETLMQGSHD